MNVMTIDHYRIGSYLSKSPKITMVSDSYNSHFNRGYVITFILYNYCIIEDFTCLSLMN